VASGGGDGKVGVWDVAVGPNKDFRPSPSFRPTDMRAFTHTLTKHSNWVTGVAAIARTSVRAGFEDLNLHDYVVSVCWDRKVRLWHIPSRTEVSCSAPLDTGLQCVAVLPSSSPHRMPSSDEEDRDPSGGTRVILAGEQHDHDGTGTPGQKLPPLAHRRGAESPPNVVMAHRGSPQVTQDRYHPRSDDDNSSDDLELVRAPRRSTVGSVVVGLRPFLQDATMPVLAAVGTQDGRVVIYDLSTGSIVRQCQPHVSAVTAITPSSSGGPCGFCCCVFPRCLQVMFVVR
jgi:WD40 repeat protein